MCGGYTLPQIVVFPGISSIFKSQALRLGSSEQAASLKTLIDSFQDAGRVPFLVGGEEGSTKKGVLV